jgi:hypothetical protein
MMFPRNRRPQDPFEPRERYGGLNQVEFNQLATYNAERNRGLLHNSYWRGQMADLQRRFNDGTRSR